MLIDLRMLREPLTEFIQSSLTKFIEEHPDTQISMVGLFGDGFHGTASLHLDTAEHSAAHVEDFIQKGPVWYGEDQQGQFCDSCWDFEYAIGDIFFPDYPDFYKEKIGGSVDFISLEGKTVRIKAEEGDEGKNEIVFPALITIISEFEPFTELTRNSPFRVGVQMRDSLCIEFWLVESGDSTS